LAFYFLQRLSAFFDGFLTFFNGFPLSPTAFRISPMAFQFSSMAFRFPRNPRKSIYGEKYAKDCYPSFVFFATHSLSFVITDKQYLRDYPTQTCSHFSRCSPPQLPTKGEHHEDHISTATFSDCNSR
jgi:hypothetical protein